ncbi:hypothetical protein KRX57_06005 [Weeksellaceae bacterium TAE3-ERU29]|nr:hypothetical protein [Weeksellaceae bacterium TAE3-ERU29]
MNKIILKRNLSFQEYQLAVRALENLGIEIEEPKFELEQTETGDFVYISEEQEQAVLKSMKNAEKGELYTQREIFEKIEQRWK